MPSVSIRSHSIKSQYIFIFVTLARYTAEASFSFDEKDASAVVYASCFFLNSSGLRPFLDLKKVIK